MNYFGINLIFLHILYIVSDLHADGIPYSDGI